MSKLVTKQVKEEEISTNGLIKTKRLHLTHDKILGGMPEPLLSSEVD